MLNINSLNPSQKFISPFFLIIAVNRYENCRCSVFKKEKGKKNQDLFFVVYMLQVRDCGSCSLEETAPVWWQVTCSSAHQLSAYSTPTQLA